MFLETRSIQRTRVPPRPPFLIGRTGLVEPSSCRDYPCCARIAKVVSAVVGRYKLFSRGDTEMESTRQLENIGIAIAPMLVDSVSEIRVVAEVHDDWIQRRYDVVHNGKLVEGVEGERSMSRSVNDALSDLRRDMLKEGQGDWHHCSYVLGSDGTFKMEFDRSRPPSA
jgi:hypothetical protein